MFSFLIGIFPLYNWNDFLFLIGIFSFFLTFRVLYFSFWNCTLLLKSKYSCYFFMIFLKIRYSLAVMERYAVLVGQIIPRTMDTQWRHESKKYEYLGWCVRQNMLRPYLKIWEWELIFGRAVKAISSPGVRSPWIIPLWILILTYSCIEIYEQAYQWSLITPVLTLWNTYLYKRPNDTILNSRKYLHICMQLHCVLRTCLLW